VEVYATANFIIDVLPLNALCAGSLL